MSTPLYARQEADFEFTGDYVKVDGTLQVVGIADFDARIDANAGITVTGAITATAAVLTTPTILGATLSNTITGTAATLQGCTLAGTMTGSSLTISGVTLTGAVTIGTQMKLTAPSGTTGGALWTSGAPELTAGQLFIKITAGSTTYRIPLWLDA